MKDTSRGTDIDRLIHEPARLGILAVLVSVDEADFVFLLGVTGLTRGNLSAHLAKLEGAGYIDTTRTYHGTPRTTYRLSSVGTDAIDRYVTSMEANLQSLRP